LEPNFWRDASNIASPSQPRVEICDASDASGNDRQRFRERGMLLKRLVDSISASNPAAAVVASSSNHHMTGRPRLIAQVNGEPRQKNVLPQHRPPFAAPHSPTRGGSLADFRAARDGRGLQQTTCER
jgi:hypothetical protein